MIYILVGSDIKKRNEFIKKISHKLETFFLSASQATEAEVNNYSENVSLFGDSPVIVVENILSEGKVILDLKKLADSETTFIFLEDKMLVSEEKKYKKFATVERFEIKEAKKIPSLNTFDIANAFARKDKVTSWMLYREAIEAGVAPEAISGILFWKIKTMILNSDRNFKREELVHQTSELVSLYHQAHKGERDFTVGLEQFILSSLT